MSPKSLVFLLIIMSCRGYSLGQSAQVTVDSLGGRHFNGRIQEINAAAEFLPRNVQTRDDREHEVFGVKVHIDNPNNVLKSGMSATVSLQ